MSANLNRPREASCILGSSFLCEGFPPFPLPFPCGSLTGIAVTSTLWVSLACRSFSPASLRATMSGFLSVSSFLKSSLSSSCPPSGSQSWSSSEGLSVPSESSPSAAAFSAALRSSYLACATAASAAMAAADWFGSSVFTPSFSASPNDLGFFGSGVAPSPVGPVWACSLSLCPTGGTVTRDSV